MTQLVELAGVSKTFQGPRPVEALHSTSLTICRGEHIAVQGPSGAGKSTLLNIIGLLDRPTTGSYRFDGTPTEELTEPARAAIRGFHVGLVFQSYHLMSHRSAVDNVALPLLVRRVRKRTRRALARVALERVQLTHRADAYPSEMSGGERQRVAIARAVVGRPDLLLCDEPTGNLDSRTASTVLELLDSFVTDGIAVVIVTHDDQVAGRARRRLVVVDGVVSDA